MLSPCPEGFSRQGSATAQTWICNFVNYNLWGGGGQYGAAKNVGQQRTLGNKERLLAYLLVGILRMGILRILGKMHDSQRTWLSCQGHDKYYKRFEWAAQNT
jgi:hypothetical protein